MGALVCEAIGGEDHLRLREDWPEPEAPPPGGLVIDVRAASVNFPDTLIIRDLYQHRVPPPFVPGNEVSGLVAALGSGTEGVAVGDRVLALTGTGAFAERVVLRPPLRAIPIPTAMPFDDAAAFNLTFGTAAHGWERAGLIEGESVLVLGAAGGCGSAAVQTARALGARVVAVAGGDAKAELCRSLGADVVIDHHRSTGRLSDTVKECTAGEGVDVVFDTVGGEDVSDLLRCLRWHGRYLVVGFASGAVPVLKANQTILKSVSVVGVAYGATALRDPKGNQALFDRLFNWYRQGSIRPHIGHAFGLEDGAQAVRVVRDRQALGKVVIEL